MIVERPTLERRVLASLDASRIPVLLGGSGTGRTSLLIRLSRQIGHAKSQYLDFAAAATTPERLLSSVVQACAFDGHPAEPRPADSPRAAFDGLGDLLDCESPDGPVTFLIDEILDVRTFESFPGLRHGLREIVGRLAASPNRFVLASRFTARTHRVLRDAPARFEVIHLPPLDVQEVTALARQLDGHDPDWAAHVAPSVASLTDGRASYTTLLLESLAMMGSRLDPVAALAGLMAPDGRLMALCRESYEFRLQRARGYGALKGILSVLAEDEPLNLTEISQRVHRTPGSTKDYLSWLEDVDLVTSQRKRYSFDDPLLRLYVRLYARAVPPTDDDLVREVQAYASARLPLGAAPPPPEPALAAAQRSDTERQSGIIEID